MKRTWMFTWQSFYNTNYFSCVESDNKSIRECDSNNKIKNTHEQKPGSTVTVEEQTDHVVDRDEMDAIKISLQKFECKRTIRWKNGCWSRG